MRIVNLSITLAAATLAALSLTVAPARADQIDGNWCFTDGRHLTIDGPAIITPGGTSMTGDYDRHGFRYVVPAGEADAGAQVDMVQFDDYTVQVTTTAPAGTARTEIWKPCDFTT